MAISREAARELSPGGLCASCEVHVVCDECNTPQDTANWTAAEARAEARTDGWAYRRGRDLCPECATSGG